MWNLINETSCQSSHARLRRKSARASAAPLPVIPSHAAIFRYVPSIACSLELALQVLGMLNARPANEAQQVELVRY